MKKDLVRSLSPALSGAQRRQLRALAHHLNAIVTVGHGALSDNLIQNLGTALFDHELVKVKVLKSCQSPIDVLARDLAAATGSACIQQVGRTMTFYKANPEAKEPIVLKAAKNKA